MKRCASIFAALLLASAAQAQTPLNSTPGGAAVPSAQQTTGSTTVAPHSPALQPAPVDSNSANTAQRNEPPKNSGSGGGTVTDGSAMRKQDVR